MSEAHDGCDGGALTFADVIYRFCVSSFSNGFQSEQHSKLLSQGTRSASGVMQGIFQLREGLFRAVAHMIAVSHDVQMMAIECQILKQAHRCERLRVKFSFLPP